MLFQIRFAAKSKVCCTDSCLKLILKKLSEFYHGKPISQKRISENE